MRGLQRRARDEAREIAAKYIFPPVTVECAVLYLPTGGPRAEIARIPGLTEQTGREHCVLVMGPTLFPALLRTIHLGFVTLALGDKAGEIRDLPGVTRAEMLNLDDALERLTRQACAFSGTIERARVRSHAIGGKLRDPGVSVAVPAGLAEPAAALAGDLETIVDPRDGQ